MEPKEQKSDNKSDEPTLIVHHDSPVEPVSTPPQPAQNDNTNTSPSPQIVPNPQEAPGVTNQDTELPKNYDPKDFYFDVSPEDKQKPSANKPFFQPSNNYPSLNNVTPATAAPSASVYTDPAQEEEVEKTKTGFNKRKVAFIAVSCLVIVGGLILAHSLIFSKPTYKKTDLINNGYAYSFLYYANPVETQSGKYNVITSNAISTIMSLSPYKKDCHTEFPNLAVAFQVNIQGKEYSACSANNRTTILSYFQYDGIWQQALVLSANGVVKVNNAFAKQLIDSITIF